MKICFEFKRGPRDGEILEGCPDKANIAEFEMDLATAYYWETNHGSVGEEFFVLSPYADALRPTGLPEEKIPPEHKYCVAERVPLGTDIWVVADYVGSVRACDVPDAHRCPWYERLVNLRIPEIVEVHKNFPELPLRLI
jgi:hypothetical protein